MTDDKADYGWRGMTSSFGKVFPLALSDAKAGMAVMLDNDFTCAHAGQVFLKEDKFGLYFDCRQGRHYLDGQDGPDGFLVGIFAIPDDMEDAE